VVELLSSKAFVMSSGGTSAVPGRVPRIGGVSGGTSVRVSPRSDVMPSDDPPSVPPEDPSSLPSG